jgi:GTP-binding protein
MPLKVNKMKFTVALIGRPNVGKSTLFNRLAGKRLALVDNTPGVTRDRREGVGTISDLSFRMFDTAGLEEAKEGSLFARMREQTDAAVEQSDIIIMMIDARAGVTPLDEYFAQWLRKQKKHTILVANKCEGTKADHGLYEAFKLGLGTPVGISSEHGDGIADLYGEILKIVQKQGWDNEPEPEPEEEIYDDEGPDDSTSKLIEGDLEYDFAIHNPIQDKPLQMVVLGRPNAGKSTLINHMLGEDRLITGPEAGITRDSISVNWEYEGQEVKMFDTAGLRRKGKVVDKLEKLSVADALRAAQFAEIVVLLIDAELGIEKQDLKIANLMVQEGRGLVIALNKWDLVEDRLGAQRKAADVLARSLPQLKGVKVIQFSALTGFGVSRLMPTVIEAHRLWNARIATSPLNRWLADTIDKHPPPLASGRRIKIRFMAQIKTRPPTFVLFCNHPSDMPDSYVRYLENDLRAAFNLPATPLRFLLRKGENPYEGRRKKRK